VDIDGSKLPVSAVSTDVYEKFLKTGDRTLLGWKCADVLAKSGKAVFRHHRLPWFRVAIGLHGTGEAGASRKKEGDESSPAGVFKLFSVFGLANSAQVRFLRFPYQQITATTEAIDDPQSRYYNRIVDRAAITRPDWSSSSESMLRVGEPYRWGIMIEHNW
jgi:L,D-peptidoglycan transpeptidase YkuD (ErfK/YbiS/YcfS/YnhG family)